MGYRYTNALVNLKQKGVKVDYFGVTLQHHGFHAVSFLFADLAKSFSEGSYLERDFGVRRGDIPATL